MSITLGVGKLTVEQEGVFAHVQSSRRFNQDLYPVHIPQIEKVDRSGQKFCAKCGEWHGRDKFHKDSNRPDGLDVYCASYRNQMQRMRDMRNRPWKRKSATKNLTDVDGS